MLNEQTLWRAAITVAILLLVMMILQPQSEQRDRSAPRFDEPGLRPAIWRTIRV